MMNVRNLEEAAVSKFLFTVTMNCDEGNVTNEESRGRVSHSLFSSRIITSALSTKINLSEEYHIS